MFVAVSVLGLVVVVAIRRWMLAPLPAGTDRSVLPGRRQGASALLRSPVIWGFAVMFFAYDTVVWASTAGAPPT